MTITEIIAMMDTDVTTMRDGSFMVEFFEEDDIEEIATALRASAIDFIGAPYGIAGEGCSLTVAFLWLANKKMLPRELFLL